MRSPRRLGLLYLLFFCSGASGLIFEILWIRGLGLRFGTTAPAISTVLAAFMAGLAAGNLTAGRIADRHPRPLALYRRVEVAIGATGLTVSLLLLRGDFLLTPASRLLAETGSLEGPLRFLLFFGLLIAPATLMGATLPVMARALVRSGVQGRVMGSLYAVNTAGAVAGALLPDLLLIPSIGMTATAGCAAIGNFAVAAGVGWVRVAPPVITSRSARRPPTPRLPLVLYGVSGLCAMGYEVLWSRVHHHWSMGQAASFAVLLATFLVFLSLGSWLATPLADRTKSPLAVAATLLAATGPAAFGPILLADRWAESFNRLLPSIRGVHRATPSEALALALANSVFLEAIACLLMGAAFPFLAAAAVRERDAARATGSLYAANTLAGVVGSVLAGFVLLPTIGVQASLLLLASLATATGLAVALQLRPLPRAAVGLGLVAAVAMVATAVTLPGDHLRRAYFSSFHGADTTIVELREGTTTTAAVARRGRFGEPAYLLLLTPGVTMSDTQIGAQRYMGLMGHLPMLLSEERTDALLICYGVGNTARSLLSWPGLKQLDVVDISPEVLSMSGHFDEVHGTDPLADPRTKALVGDGRHHLLVTDRMYDVITSEPPPPTDAGVVNLYTRQFYAAARGRLKPGGVVAQWLPLFQLTGEETTSIVAAMTEEFPYTSLYYGYGFQWILMGSKQPLEPDPTDWARAVGTESVHADLARYGADEVQALLGSRLQDDAGLRAMTQGVRPLTDDLPTLQYPRRGLSGEVEVPAGLVGTINPVVAGLPALNVRPTELHEFLLSRDYGDLVAASPHDVHLQSLVRIGSDWADPAQAHVDRGGSDPKALFTLARRAAYRGEPDEAIRLLERIDPDSVGRARHAFLEGRAHHELGDRAAAVRAWDAAGAASDDPRFIREMQLLSRRAAAPAPPVPSQPGAH